MLLLLTRHGPHLLHHLNLLYCGIHKFLWTKEENTVAHLATLHFLAHFQMTYQSIVGGTYFFPVLPKFALNRRIPVVLDVVV